MALVRAHELCGVVPPDNLQGQSLVGTLRDANEPGRGWAMTQVLRRRSINGAPQAFSGFSLRTPRFRYTEWDEGRAGRELYDHDADPQELTNLAEQPDYADTVAELSAHPGFLWVARKWPRLSVPSRRTFTPGILPSDHSKETSLRHRGFAPFPTPLDWQEQPLRPTEFPEGPRIATAARKSGREMASTGLGAGGWA